MTPIDEQRPAQGLRKMRHWERGRSAIGHSQSDVLMIKTWRLA